MLCFSGVSEPDLAVSFEPLGLLSSGKKSFHLMNKDLNLRLLLWISPAGSFLYTWDPPQRTLSTLPHTQASSTVNSGHPNFLADLNSPSPFPRVNNPLGFLHLPPLAYHPSLPSKTESFIILYFKFIPAYLLLYSSYSSYSSSQFLSCK
ncbi:hypothetical protein CRENBAI_020379 [Crenichthys baileyi]|uniref:Uncharacterized protein n=1 Tax=Crenichthys baileyi TaxID=28760 RepID=A0AAV9QU75_9TELE